MKHSKKRIWFRGPLFFSVGLGLAAALCLVGGDRRVRRSARLVAAFTLLCTLCAGFVHDRSFAGWARQFSPSASVEGVRWLLDRPFRESRLGALDRASRDALAPFRLPIELREELEASRTGIGVVPWRLGYCEANGLRCVPPRTLQLYSAYSPSLDQWVADGLRENPPTHLLVHRPEAQRRLYFSTAPRFWTAVEQLYDVAESQEDAGVLVLRLRHSPRSGFEPKSQILEPRAGRYALPSGDGRGWIEIDLRPRLGVRLLGALAWIPPVEIELSRGAETRRWRIGPSLAAFGLRSVADDSLDSLERWFSGSGTTRPAELRLSGPGATFYSVDEVRFKRAEGPVPVS
jgi:hypothetical protein